MTQPMKKPASFESQEATDRLRVYVCVRGVMSSAERERAKNAGRNARRERAPRCGVIAISAYRIIPPKKKNHPSRGIEISSVAC